jgi:hypothetical protein
LTANKGGYHEEDRPIVVRRRLSGCRPGSVDEAWAGHAPQRPYQYVSLDAAIPEGYLLFDPRAITDNGRIYGNLVGCGPEACSNVVAVYQGGEIVPLQEGIALDANNRGTVGGFVQRADGSTQAALFRGREVELIPALPGEIASDVLLLSNSGFAFVESFDANSNVTYYLTRRGQVTPLNFGPDRADQFDLNDLGIVSGTSDRPGNGRAFRYNPFAGRFTLLDPLPTESDSWGQAINNRGDVLGYSFIPGALERIGVWRGTEFHT